MVVTLVIPSFRGSAFSFCLLMYDIEIPLMCGRIAWMAGRWDGWDNGYENDETSLLVGPRYYHG